VKVVDASVLCGVLLGDPPSFDAVITSPASVSVQLHSTMLVEVETLNALRGLARGGQIDADLANLVANDFASVPLVLYPHSFLRERIWALRHNLTAYDASYLALAEMLDGSELLTRDAGLAQAARASLGDARVQLIR
jgi:predicted nucleic acid-binding protein